MDLVFQGWHNGPLQPDQFDQNSSKFFEVLCLQKERMSWTHTMPKPNLLAEVNIQ